MSLVREEVLREFQRIPGVGRSIAEDLWELGFHSVKELRKQNPETLYRKLCQHAGSNIDRNMRHIYRCVSYYASIMHIDPEMLSWWNDYSEEKKLPFIQKIHVPDLKK